ncbi:MAG: hypothetical protein IPK50_14005 [Fibrobacterota bacterium]|nr:MAG: hypothetical protein IPK50_14005 [Fibrobacterota bacterium]
MTAPEYSQKRPPIEYSRSGSQYKLLALQEQEERATDPRAMESCSCGELAIAHHMVSAREYFAKHSQPEIQNGIVQWEKVAVQALRTADLWFFADAANPFVATGGRVSRLARAWIFPPAGEHVVTTYESISEQSNFVILGK